MNARRITIVLAFAALSPAHLAVLDRASTKYFCKVGFRSSYTFVLSRQPD